jgi:preprotein translocase subunit SecD
MKRIRKNISLALLVLILATLSTVKIARANNSTHAAPAKLSVGLWGGTDLEMQVSSQGSTLEFDCAQGTISEPSSSMNPENSKRRALSKHTLAQPEETSRPARTRLIPVQ